MSDKPYTDADVELLARVEYEHDQARSSIDGAYRVPWDAGRRIVGRVYRDRARAALDALVADGWRRASAAPDAAAAGTTGPDWSHEIAFDTDGTWSVGHPDGCPGQTGGDCDVARLAAYWVDGGAFAAVRGRRYRCAVETHDRFLLGARIEPAPSAGLAPWDQYDTCGRCVLVTAVGGPVRVAQADCWQHGIHLTGGGQP